MKRSDFKHFSISVITIFLFYACLSETGPVTSLNDRKCAFNNIEFTQTYPQSYRISSRDDLIVSSRNISTITLQQMENNQEIHSADIPVSYTEVDDKYRLEFSYGYITRSESDILNLILTFKSENKTLCTIDTSFVLLRITREDMETFFRFDILGQDYQQQEYQDYDLRDSSLVFTNYSALRLYEYTYHIDQLDLLHTFTDVPLHMAANNAFSFISIDNTGLFRYNHTTDSLDLQIDLSQLEYDIGERKFSYGMVVYRDTLFVSFYDTESRVQTIAKFDPEGNYFSSIFLHSFTFGSIWKLAFYEDLLFTFSDEGMMIWVRSLDKIEDFDPVIPHSSTCRIFDGYFYFVENTSILRMEMSRVLEVWSPYLYD